MKNRSAFQKAEDMLTANAYIVASSFADGRKEMGGSEIGYLREF